MRSSLVPVLTIVSLACTTVSALAADTRAEPADLWRASKLVGVRIYGPDNKLVGKVSDVLLNHDGHVQSVVVGVGGFLGVGEKDVDLPFDQVTFTDKPVPGAPMMPAAEPLAVPGNAATGTSTGVGTPPEPASAMGVPTSAALGATPAQTDAAPLPPSTAYPDHGQIALTADQLKSAPTFTFAR